MRNADYWARRFKIMEDALKDQAYDYVENLEEQFDKAIAQIDTQMRAWYQRFATNNGITYAEAQKMLTAGELKDFKWTVQEYIKAGKEHAISGAWAKELENASARVHISRLDSLKIQLRQQAEVLTEARIKATASASELAYTESYYHTAFEVQRGLGVGWTMQAINKGEVEKLLSRPWTVDNQTFRARCWTDKTKLVETVNQELTRMIAIGEAPDKAIAAIANRFGVSKQNAGRVVMTESAYFASAAQKDCFNDLGVEQYEVVEALDASTCETCGALDGQVFKMSEYQPGATAPPFHPWCRGCTCPYFADMKDIGERYARDVVTGERYKLPKNITYQQWKEMQDAAHGSGTVDKARKKVYNESADRAQWEKYREQLGSDAPKTLADFQNFKYDNEEYYGYMKLDYQRRNRLFNHPETALPNAEKATADDRKFTEYLFNADNNAGYAKGKNFANRLGYDAENFGELKTEILQRAAKYPSTYKGSDIYGDKYEQKIILYGKNGTPANVVVGWKVKDGKVWMTSAYIKEVD